jgi:hypothetical protein
MRPHSVVVAVLLSLPAPAFAQNPDDHARGDEQFRRGREAMSQGDCRTALQLFRKSQALEPGRGKLLNMALCEEQVGLFAQAWKHLLEAQPQFPEEDERASIVKQHLDTVSPQVPHLEIHLALGAPRGTTVTLDGDPVPPSSFGTGLAIDPGKHVVAAIAAGASEGTYEIIIARSAHRTLEVTPVVTGPVVASPWRGRRRRSGRCRRRPSPATTSYGRAVSPPSPWEQGDCSSAPCSR